MLINITEAARSYFNNIIAMQQKDPVAGSLNLRIKVLQPGTYNASIELKYCKLDEHDPTDVVLDFTQFMLYVEQNSVFALTGAIIDYKPDPKTKINKLHIKAPWLKPDLHDAQTGTLATRIKDFLAQTINPNLAKHNGGVELAYIKELEGVSESGVEVGLVFGGGCKGCSMIDLTLKLGIEKALKQKFSQIIAVKDVTDHATGKTPFYS